MKKAPEYLGNRRLLKLADFLENLPRKRFNYGVFVGSDWEGEQDLSCGTTACAIGWAAAMLEFRKFGLQLRGNAAGRLYPAHGVPRGASTRDDGTMAGSALFSLGEAEWDYLFLPESESCWKGLFTGPRSNATAKQVARHIRRFVAWRTKRRAKR